MNKQIKNKIISVIAVLSMLAMMITALPAVAETVNDFAFTVDNGKATITGFDKDYIGVLNIPATLNNYPVAKIGDNAFKDCKKITEVTIPNGVTSIGKNAFKWCGAITKVVLPETLKGIDNEAFYDCPLLTDINIPTSIAFIGYNAFRTCDALKNIQISPNMTGIASGTFWDCYNLEHITIPKSIVSIGDHAFCQNNSLKDVYYGGSAEDWKKISIAGSNDKLLNATIHYNTKIDAPTITPTPDTVTPPPVTITPVPDVTPAPNVTTAPIITPTPNTNDNNNNNNNNNGGTTTIINNNTTNTIVTNTTETNNNINNNTTTNNNITNNTNITNNIVNNVSLVLYIGKTTATVGDESVENDVAPIVRNDRTMLPARFVAEQLGATVSWNQALQQVTITKGDKVITIPIGSDNAYINGEAQALDSPAFVENDRTYTPVRFIAENLDANVEWNGNDQSVTITEK